MEDNKTNEDLIKKLDHKSSQIKVNAIYKLSDMFNLYPHYEDILLAKLREAENRNDVAFGFVKVSWILAIVLVEKGKAKTVNEVRKIISEEWNELEREDFLSYVKHTPEVIEKL